MRSEPPFRAEHIGSLLRPPELLAARRAFDDRRLPAEELRRIEDRWIVEAVRLQGARRPSVHHRRRIPADHLLRPLPRRRERVHRDGGGARVRGRARAEDEVHDARLALSPQCGFASTAPGNPLAPADQEAKLARVVEVARSVWG